MKKKLPLRGLLRIFRYNNIKVMNKSQVKEQLQEDILTILESWGIDEVMTGQDYNAMVTALCEVTILNINKLKED